jgi:hypothetical protein
VYRTAAVLTAALILAAPASAGDGILGFGLFKKRSKPPDPTAKVKQLVGTLQSDPDEKKRKQAAEELRGIDPRNNGDIVTALVGSLQRDPSPAVRAEAAESLGKMKPVYQPAGIALETALGSDPDAKVREAVRSALWQYHLNGYRTPAGDPFATQTAEPPLARPQPPPAPPTTRTAASPPRPAAGDGFRPITNSVGKGVFYQPTPEPPLAKPKSAPPSRPTDGAKDSAVLPPPQPAPSVPDPAAKPTPPATPAPTPTPPPTGVPTVSVPPTLPAPAPSTPEPSGGVPTVTVPPLPPPGK